MRVLLDEQVPRGLAAMDKHMPADRYVSPYSIGVVLVRAMSNRLSALVPIVPRVLEAVARVRPGEVVEVGA